MSTKRLKAKWLSWFGRLHVKKRNYQSALPYFQRVVSLLPNSVYAHCYVGYCYSSLGQYEEAVKAYYLALQIKPDSAYAHAQLRCAFTRLGRQQEAVEEFGRAFRI